MVGTPPPPVGGPPSGQDGPAADLSTDVGAAPVAPASVRSEDVLPSTRAGRRRSADAAPPVSAGRALAGAAVAVAGVALGVAALLVLTGDDPAPLAGGPSVSAVPTAGSSGGDGPETSAPTAAPTAAPTSTPTATPRATPPASAAPTPTPAPASPAPASPAPEAPATPAPASQTATAPGVVPLTILNNSRIRGLADRASQGFADAGWPLATIGNFSGGPVAVTTVYFAPGQEQAAQQLVADFPGVVRVLPRFEGLPGSGLTVVLTRDYDA